MTLSVPAMNEPNERGGQQERDRRRRAEPRQDSDQRADEDPDETVEKIVRLQRDLEGIEDPGEDLHAQNPKGPVGSCVFSQSWKSA